jgi:leucyl aminopeptidase
MPIKFVQAAEIPSAAQVVGVPVFAGGKTPTTDIELDTKYLARRGFEGKPGQCESLLADDGTTIVAVGMGTPATVDADRMRTAAAALARAGSRAKRVATTLLDAAPSLDRTVAAQAIAEGMALAAYDFTNYKSSSKPSAIDRVIVVTPKDDAVGEGLRRGEVAARAVSLARDLINEPARDMTPRRLADVAAEVAEANGLEIVVWGEEEIEAERLGGLAGVAAGSDEPARLIDMRYEPRGEPVASVTLVGKGITFDSGGLSIKTGDGMMTMKTDMSGAAAVIAAMSALRDLDVPVRVRAIVPATENMPSGSAIKPGDVLRFRNGKTAEVLNTDAEGRLVLADGLSLAAEEQPDAIIDLATLTGACMVALGSSIAGVMGNDDGLVDQVVAASKRAGESTWPLPLPEFYRRDIDSEIADMKNIGKPGGRAGALTAGLFLKEFVGDVPWVHMDIAGPARSESDEGWLRKGGTGFGVRTVLELLSNYERASSTQ